MDKSDIDNFTITTTINVKKHDDMYVGIFKELPIVVQGDNIDDFKEKITEALVVYMQHHQDEFIKHIPMKAAA
ncbi:MAG: hypothetical protein OXP12_00005 [Thaumarchaeota archaeon]|nr:hypothetical protein [Nitrososphaerota archaeon]